MNWIDVRAARSSVPWLVLVAALLFTAGCGPMELTSRWRSANIALDGKSNSWAQFAVASKDKRASVVLLNDAEYLYAGLVTADRDLQRLILREGLTCWFDREGGETKRFGIRYPVGGPPSGGGPFEPPAMSEQGAGPEPDTLPTGTGELEVFAMGEGQSQRMSRVATGGIDGWISRSRDTLFYMLKIPLADKGVHPFAIEISPGAMLGVGVETVMNRRTESGRGSGFEMGGGSEGNYGGRRGGGGMGREGAPPGGQMMGGRPDPIKLWASVRLASGEVSTP